MLWRCRHTSRFLITFLIFLPFALWEPCKWLTPGVIAVVGFLLMGVESIGVQIEQPFSVLPLELLCSIIKTNIMESLVVRGNLSQVIGFRPEGQVRWRGGLGAFRYNLSSLSNLGQYVRGGKQLQSYVCYYCSSSHNKWSKIHCLKHTYLWHWSSTALISGLRNAVLQLYSVHQNSSPCGILHVWS